MVYNTYEIIIKFTYRKDYLKVLNKLIGRYFELKFHYGKNTIALTKVIHANKYIDILKSLKIKNTKIKMIKRQVSKTEQLIEL